MERGAQMFIILCLVLCALVESRWFEIGPHISKMSSRLGEALPEVTLPKIPLPSNIRRKFLPQSDELLFFYARNPKSEQMKAMIDDLELKIGEKVTRLKIVPGQRYARLLMLYNISPYDLTRVDFENVEVRTWENWYTPTLVNTRSMQRIRGVCSERNLELWGRDKKCITQQKRDQFSDEWLEIGINADDDDENTHAY